MVDTDSSMMYKVGSIVLGCGLPQFQPCGTHCCCPCAARTSSRSWVERWCPSTSATPTKTSAAAVAAVAVVHPDVSGITAARCALGKVHGVEDAREMVADHRGEEVQHHVALRNTETVFLV
eukprot:COSAG06_NODE_187_length_20790_cov_46.433232_10_plen_121_part_00